MSQLDTLTQINLDDLVSSFGWQDYPVPAALVRTLFNGSARKFAQQMVEYDDLVGRVGLSEASCRFLQSHYIHDLRVHGRENIPLDGPVLFLSSHPGMTDTVSLFTAINRLDLRIIALHRPFLASLVNVSKQLSYISDDPAERMRAVRQVASQLRAGGAAVTFPAGQIEPDPDVHPGALASLCDWTDSAGVFLRFAPQTKIVPVLVSGVIWERTTRHWLTRIKHTREEREKLAAALQLLAMIVRDVRPTTVHVRFGKPITIEEVDSLEPDCIHEKLMERMHSLIQNRDEGEGESVL
jgi:1-acyl-sn-glycerol-3-phosphate acyltransferase